MQNSTPILTLTVVATGAIAAQRFVGPTGAVAAAAGNALGVSRYLSAQAGDKIPVDTLGTAYVEAGAAIAAGALVESDSVGRAITRNAGVALGRVAPGDPGASAAGKFTEIILFPN
ncbi:MAG: DUF2190 family protein [Rhodocyclaceae bacterium]|nr:DUF2190 family protein [Rhodocyclaceae bacterium]